MKLWQCYASLALAIAATLGTFTLMGGASRQVQTACAAPSLEFDRDACAALGR